MRSYEWRQVYEAVVFPAPLQPLIIYRFFAISAAKVRLSEQKTKFWSSKCREIFANSAFRIKIIGRESTNGKGMRKQGAKRQQLVPPHPVVLVFILNP